MSHPIEQAILRTLIYADIFRFPLTKQEIHHYLIHGTPVSLSKIESMIQHSEFLKKYISQSQGYVALAEHAMDIERRIMRDEIMKDLRVKANRYGKFLSYIPFIRMVALTGALAAGNPTARENDFDYLLITKPGRVWIARALAVMVVRIVRLSGDSLCPNYVLSSNQLEQSQQDVFMAREITQMIPIFGEDMYQNLRQANHWTTDFMPNATIPLHKSAYQQLPPLAYQLKSLIERILSGSLGESIENWEYQRKAKKFAKDLHTQHSNAIIDTQHVKGHFQDHRSPILDRYYDRLSEYGIEPFEYQQAGD